MEYNMIMLNQLLTRIINDISAIEDAQLKTMNMEVLKNTILSEKHKIERNENYIKYSQELGVDCGSLIEMIENCLVSEINKKSGENRL